MGELYAPFVRTENPILVMDPQSAELTKYAANAHARDTHLVHERDGAPLRAGRRRRRTTSAGASGADRRIGYPFLFPGVGYGGSCFPKDVKALVRTARDAGIEFDAAATPSSGQRAPEARSCVDKVDQALRRRPRRAAASPSGASPSSRAPTTCARRPSLVDDRGAAEGAAPRRRRTIPRRSDEARKRLRRPDQLSPRQLRRAARAPTRSSIVTEWNEFRRPDFERMKTLMKHAGGLRRPQRLRADVMRALGFTYYPIGRPAVDGGVTWRVSSSPAVPASSARTSATGCSARPRRHLHRQLPDRLARQHRAPRSATSASSSSSTTSPTSSTSTGRSTRSCTSRRRRARSTTSRSRSRR